MVAAPLVRALAYDAHGNVAETPDPTGRITRVHRDMLRRFGSARDTL